MGAPPCGLTPSRLQHPVLGHEILAGIGDELRIAGMVDGLDTDHPVHDFVIVRMDMLDQLELGVPGADDQDFRSAAHGFHDFMVVLLVFGLAAAADRAALALQVTRRIGRMDHRFLDVVRADVHDAGFVVIEPDDGVVMGHDFLPQMFEE